MAELLIAQADSTSRTPAQPLPAPTPAPAPTYSVGGTVTGLATGKSVTLLNNGGDAVAVNADGSFQFPTALAQGAPYAATVGTRPSGENCTVTNGSGTAGTANVTNSAVTCTLRPLFGYAFNSNDGTLSAFTLDLSTGMPTAIGTAVPVGAGPLSLTIDPAGTFAYVVNGVDNTVVAYSIDATTSMLTAVTGGTANTGNIPRGMATVAVPYGLLTRLVRRPPGAPLHRRGAS
nr:beta-propeller fold lactonase family protein [Ralstonia sp. UBA689]